MAAKSQGLPAGRTPVPAQSTQPSANPIAWAIVIVGSVIAALSFSKSPRSLPLVAELRPDGSLVAFHVDSCVADRRAPG